MREKICNDCDAQIICAEIDEVAAAISRCYDALPAPAKASAIKLGHALSNLRHRFEIENTNPPNTVLGRNAATEK